MTTHEVRIDPSHSMDGDFEVLGCPLCSGNYLHFDHVHIGGRPNEDGDFANVIVDAAGKVSAHVPEGEMAKPDFVNLRRHYISLVGDCEQCGGRFAYAFIQHKGQTMLQLIRPQWTSVAAG